MNSSSRSALLLGVALSAAAGTARADDAANTATARSLGVEGVLLAEAGRCREAVEKLERAEQLHHAPTTATRLGECEIDLGRLVAGTERLQRVVREPLPPNAHPAFAAAVAHAQRTLDKALPRIAMLRISVKAPPQVRFTLMIDDEPAPEAIVDSNRRIDPGTHKIEARANGYYPSVVTAVLDEGQTRGVTLELVPDPSAAVRAEPRAEVRGGSADKPSKVPVIAAFTVAGLGLGAGALGAGLVASKSATLSRECGDARVCPPELAPELRSAKTWATVSTIGFATAGVGLATGLVLLVTQGSAPSRETARARVRPLVGVSSVGVAGVF